MAGIADIFAQISTRYAGQSIQTATRSIGQYCSNLEFKSLLTQYDKYFSEMDNILQRMDSLFAPINDTVVQGFGFTSYQQYLSQRNQQSKEEKRKWDNSYGKNLLTYNKFETEYKNLGYTLQGNNGPKGLSQRFSMLSPDLLMQYDRTYENLREVMLSGYKNSLQLGQKIRGTKSMEYMIPFLSTKDKKQDMVLSTVLTLNESAMNQALTNRANFSLTFTRNSAGKLTDVAFGFSDRKRDDIKADLLALNGNGNGTVIEGIRRYQKNGQAKIIPMSDDLAAAYSKMKMASSDDPMIRRLFNARTGEKIKGNRITELLYYEDVINEISNNKNYQKYLDQLSSIGGSDIMDNGHEISVKTFSATGRGQMMTGTLFRQVAEAFQDTKSIKAAVTEAIQGNYKLMQDIRSKGVSEDIAVKKRQLSVFVEQVKSTAKQIGNKDWEQLFIKEYGEEAETLLSLDDEKFVSKFDEVFGEYELEED